VLAAAGAGCEGGRDSAPSGGGAPGVSFSGSRQVNGPDGSGGELSEADYAHLRDRMVQELASPASDVPITNRRVLEVLRAVPRHEFVAQEQRTRSYENHPLPIPENQTISQPYIVALMTQLLELKGDEKVLEIGTGSGYQAAILGELAAEVYSVEIRPQLHEAAKRTLESLKERGVLHYKKCVGLLGDGSKGYPPEAPYDAIIVTAAPRSLPVELLNQLKPGGRLVIPLGDFVQELQLIRKRADGTYSEEPIVPVRFVRLDRSE
jgi:protein-L-isoaspartate(D-aspartate) O-methyltransferase